MELLKHASGSAKVWLLSAAVVLAYLLVEFTLGHMAALAIGYVAVFLFIFEGGLIERGSPLRRAGTYFLGLAVLCFGNGQLMLALAGGVDALPQFEWLFDAGHISLWITAIFHLLELRQQLNARDIAKGTDNG